MNDIMNYLDDVLGNQIKYMPFGDMEDVERLVKDIFMYKLGKVYKHAVCLYRSRRKRFTNWI